MGKVEPLVIRSQPLAYAAQRRLLHYSLLVSTSATSLPPEPPLYVLVGVHHTTLWRGSPRAQPLQPSSNPFAAAHNNTIASVVLLLGPIQRVALSPCICVYVGLMTRETGFTRISILSCLSFPLTAGLAHQWEFLNYADFCRVFVFQNLDPK